MPNCPDCQVVAGERHLSSCDLGRCKTCLNQIIFCECDNKQPSIWTGEQEGVAECGEFGWFSRFTKNGWIECLETDSGAMPDINKYLLWLNENRSQMFIYKEMEDGNH